MLQIIRTDIFSNILLRMPALAMLQNQPVRRPTNFIIAKFPQADLNLSVV